MREIKANQRILGVDPGSRVAGFAIIEALRDDAFQPRDYKLINLGVVQMKADQPMSVRLGQLHKSLFNIMEEERPQACTIEQAFVGKNPHAALRLGEARGAITSAARRHEISVFEVSPAEVKKTIAGRGAASKEEIRQAVSLLFQQDLSKAPYDATDALAVALTFGLGWYNAQVRSKRPKNKIYGRDFVKPKAPTRRSRPIP